MYIYIYLWVFFHKDPRFTGQQGKGVGISLIALYHFHYIKKQKQIY